MLECAPLGLYEAKFAVDYKAKVTVPQYCVITRTRVNGSIDRAWVCGINHHHKSASITSCSTTDNSVKAHTTFGLLACDSRSYVVAYPSSAFERKYCTRPSSSFEFARSTTCSVLLVRRSSSSSKRHHACPDNTQQPAVYERRLAVNGNTGQRFFVSVHLWYILQYPSARIAAAILRFFPSRLRHLRPVVGSDGVLQPGFGILRVAGRQLQHCRHWRILRRRSGRVRRGRLARLRLRRRNLRQRLRATPSSDGQKQQRPVP